MLLCGNEVAAGQKIPNREFERFLKISIIES